MAKGKNGPKMGDQDSSKSLSSYEVMGLRIKKEILSPTAQSKAHVIIERQPSDAWEDWDRFVEEIATDENVTLTELAPGKIELKWEKYKPEKEKKS